METNPYAAPAAMVDDVQGHVEGDLESRKAGRGKRLGAPSTVRVYPNFASLAELAGLSVELASRSVGARLQRRRGEGTEFQELRDYRIGDSLRKINWKATARASRLISREYRDERNQQVVLMLDCGRRMLAQDDHLVHFDHVLNAFLALASIALRHGDAVGLLACTGQQQRWLPPQQGSGGMDMLLGAGYDLQAMPLATDYLATASALQMHQRRRALVVLVTNVRDEDDAELRAAVSMLSRCHLVMLVSLRELALDRAAATPGDELEGSICSAAAMHYLAERERAHEALRREGVNTLDVSCSELSGALIERYLSLKRSRRLWPTLARAGGRGLSGRRVRPRPALSACRSSDACRVAHQCCPPVARCAGAPHRRPGRCSQDRNQRCDCHGHGSR